MATSTQTFTLGARHDPPSVEHELRQLRKPAAAAGRTLAAHAEAGGSSSEANVVIATDQQQSPAPAPSPPWLRLKIFGAAFSFFCAGINDSTLGPLVPYILTSFSIGTGEIAVLYACSFIGWVLAAITNPLLTPHLTLGQLLFVGAAFQLLAQCLRPWSSLPVYCVSFSLQALGSGFQDAHCNTFVSGVGKKVAHRWLGFIHAMYALALVVGPLVATTVASHPTGGGEGSGPTGGVESWRRTYFVTIGANVVNIAWVVVGFRDTLWLVRWRDGDSRSGGDEEQSRRGVSVEAGQQQQEKETTLSALRDMRDMLKLKDVWLISLFFFFAAGASQTSNGWVVEYLAKVRGGDLSEVGYVPTGFSAGLLLGRLILPEPTHRFGDKRMLLLYFVAATGFQLIFWLVPNIVADAAALGVMGFFLGPFFPTGVSVASKLFPRKVQAAALSFVFLVSQAGAANFPSITGVIAAQAGVKVLQPIVLGLLVAATIFWWLVPKTPERRE